MYPFVNSFESSLEVLQDEIAFGKFRNFMESEPLADPEVYFENDLLRVCSSRRAHIVGVHPEWSWVTLFLGRLGKSFWERQEQPLGTSFPKEKGRGSKRVPLSTGSTARPPHTRLGWSLSLDYTFLVVPGISTCVGGYCPYRGTSLIRKRPPP